MVTLTNPVESKENNDAMKIAAVISRHLWNNPELSSEEINSHKFIVEFLKQRGFKVDDKFLGMNTAFLAVHGTGEPKVCIFAEYDALPTGHACGHNIIAGWAVGTFLSLSQNSGLNGTIYLVGSPAEEGRGKYASSKVKIARELKEMGIKAAFCIHPGDEWKVSGSYYARWRKSFEFIGKESHAAGAPEKGINALDAAVSFYTAGRALRNQMRPDTTVIISAIIKEGGVAVNIVPARSTVWVDLRTVDTSYLAQAAAMIDELGENIAKSYRCSLKTEELAPVTSSFKKDEFLDELMLSEGKKIITELKKPGINEDKPIGSSDVGDVSQNIPTTQLIVKISDSGVPLHSEDFLKAAGSEFAEKSMLKAIEVVSETIAKYCMMDRKQHQNLS